MIRRFEVKDSEREEVSRQAHQELLAKLRESEGIIGEIRSWIDSSWLIDEEKVDDKRHAIIRGMCSLAYDLGRMWECDWGEIEVFDCDYEHESCYGDEGPTTRLEDLEEQKKERESLDNG